jgi:hypothetical protein
MATDAKSDMTDAELLDFYVGTRLQRGDRDVPVEQLLAGFSSYLRERRQMQSMIREADDAIAAGRSGPLDLERAIREVVQELAARGVAE